MISRKQRALVRVLILPLWLVHNSFYIPYKVIETIVQGLNEVYKIWFEPNYVEELFLERINEIMK